MMQTETQVGWQDYLAIVLRRRWFFVLPCMAIITIAMIASCFLKRIYRAETILMVQDPNVVNPLIQGLTVTTPVGERLRALREELLGWSGLSRLVAELDMDKNATSPTAFEILIRRLQNDISVRMRGGDMILISYEDENPKLAQTLVNTITTIYMDRNIESQSAETTTAIDVIESEMAVYQRQLEDAEHALRDFKELYIMQMPVAIQLNQQIIELEVNLAQILVENTEEHPTVIQVTRRITELKRKRNEEIKHVIADAVAKGHDPSLYQDLAQVLDHPADQHTTEDPTIRAAREAYQAWVNRLDSPISAHPGQAVPQVQVVTTGQGSAGAGVAVSGGMATSVSLAPREEQEMARLTRDYQVYSETYQHMQARLERAKITQRLGKIDEGRKFKVLEPARLPLRPVRPNRIKIFCFSLLLGMFMGAAVAFLAEYLDQSFQSSEEVQAALELPVIGSISTIVTDADLKEQWRHFLRWFSFQNQAQLLKTHMVQPLWKRFDKALLKALLRWGL